MKLLAQKWVAAGLQNREYERNQNSSFFSISLWLVSNILTCNQKVVNVWTEQRALQRQYFTSGDNTWVTAIQASPQIAF